ncbi:hypothetical protein HHK36_009771 [Tetracentron sinense]|uniref:SURF1-like protein n=1 Tax=Tetracentron sinense TaxID=13715 RepID=A0A834ZDT8_TETSI|nr:hypothetical protein HHK36_009771 [Tetracentron sinense]
MRDMLIQLGLHKALDDMKKKPTSMDDEKLEEIDLKALSTICLYFENNILFNVTGETMVIERKDSESKNEANQVEELASSFVDDEVFMIEMLEYRRKRLELEPVMWNSISSLGGDLNSLEFRRMLSEGIFDENKSIYIGPRSRSISGVTENGYYVITPLMPIKDNPEGYRFVEKSFVSVQSPVLVNRGWVPRNWKDKPMEDSHDGGKLSQIASSSTVEEAKASSWWWFWSKIPKNIMDQAPAVTPVKVVGVVRESEKPSIFVPSNDPSSGQWFYVDVPAIARASGLPENTIYIEDINENVNHSRPYPVPKDVNTLIRSSVMPQDHLNYTLTWYSLSAAVTFMAFKRLKPKRRRR